MAEQNLCRLGPFTVLTSRSGSSPLYSSSHNGLSSVTQVCLPPLPTRLGQMWLLCLKHSLWSSSSNSFLIRSLIHPFRSQAKGRSGEPFLIFNPRLSEQHFSISCVCVCVCVCVRACVCAHSGRAGAFEFSKLSSHMIRFCWPDDGQGIGGGQTPAVE